MIRLILALFLAIPVMGQYVSTVLSTHPAVAGATPGFVSAVAKQSVTTAHTNPPGQTACTIDTICTPYAETILSGNIAVDFFSYTRSAGSISVTDSNDKSDTYTCANGTQIAASHIWVGYCIAATTTAGAHVSKINFANTGTSQTLQTVQPTSWYNTNGTLDGSVGSCTGTSTTTINCGSVTTTVANDLIVVFACTDAAHTFTAGSGYTLGAVTRSSGCVSEYKVNTGTGVVTPTITVNSSASYTEIVLALKANSQGVQPSSGTYPNGWVQRICSDTNATAAATWAVQCPNSGNFLISMNAGGGGQTISSITDTTNTWVQAKCGNSGQTDAWYVGGAATDATGLMTFNTNAAGDDTYTVYDVAGAPSSPNISCANYANGAQSATSTVTLWNSGTTPQSLDLISFIPTPTAGLTFATISQAKNTVVSASAPSTCLHDMVTFGGESLDGPSGTPGDENNGWSHCSISAGASTQYAFNQASSSETGNAFAATVVGVYGTGATAIIDAANNRGTSGTTLDVTVHSTKSGAAAIVGISDFGGSNTVSSVAFSNGSGGTSSFTKCTSCAIASGNPRTEVWYNTNEPSAATTVHIVFNGTGWTQLDAGYLEIIRGTGTFAADVGGSASTTSTAGGTDTGASVTTTNSSGSPSVVVASFNSSNSISACPKSGNEFEWASLVWNAGGNDGGFCALLTTSVGAAHQPVALDGSGTSGTSFVESTWSIK